MSGIRWETPADPTLRSGFPSRWASVLDELQTRPNEWAVVYEQVDGEQDVKVRDKRIRLVQFAGRHGVMIEAVSRKVDGKIRIYARVLRELQ